MDKFVNIFVYFPSFLSHRPPKIMSVDVRILGSLLETNLNLFLIGTNSGVGVMGFPPIWQNSYLIPAAGFGLFYQLTDILILRFYF